MIEFVGENPTPPVFVGPGSKTETQAVFHQTEILHMHPNSFSSERPSPRGPMIDARPRPKIRYLSDLTEKQQRLLKKFRQVSFGRIEDLVFQNGDPVARPAPKTRRNIRLRGSGIPKPPDPEANFELKDEHVKFFTFLAEEREGFIASIEIRDGLPHEICVEEVD